MKKLLFIVGLLALTGGFESEAVAQAEQDQPLQEVFQTELVYPQEKGAFQFTSASTFSNLNKKFSNDLVIEYGLTQAWQIGLQWESFARSKAEDGSIARGSGDLNIGTKYSFMNMRGSHFHSAVGFELGLPAASAKGISEGKIAYQPYGIIARDFPKLSRLQLFSQLGIAFEHSITSSSASEGYHDGKTIEWNSGMFVPYRQVRFTTEVNWSHGAVENKVYFTPGIVWRLPRDLEFGVGIPIGLSRDAESVRTIVKFVYEFGGKKTAGKKD